MSQDQGDGRRGTFDHLFAEPIQDTLSGAGYGDWRSLTAPDAVSLNYGFPFPDAFPVEELDACVDAVLAEEGSQALQYGGGEYAASLPEAIADRARERGLAVGDPDDELLLTNGATHAVDTVAGTFLDPGDTVFVESPTFMGTLRLFDAHGVEVEGVPIDADGLDVAALETRLRERREAGATLPKLVYTIPTFQNPTGVTMPRERRERLLDLAAEFDFLVLEDDAYGELRFEGDPVSPLAALDDEGRVVHAATVSKTIAPGVRTGWLVADPEIRAQLRRVAAGGTNTFTQSVLGRYFQAGHYESVVEGLVDAYAERRDHLLDSLAERMPADADWTEPAGGFFVWVQLPGGLDANDLLETAAEEGVTYLPGEYFYPGEGGHDRLRLSFSHADPAELDRGVAALARAIERAR